MSQIGNFGSHITFETSDKRILTPTNFKRTVSGRWTNHGSIGNKQPTEFLGAGLDKVTFQISIKADHGVKPRNTINNIENAVKSGSVEPLVIGGKKVGDGNYRITSMSESWDVIYQKGELFSATLDITMEEYA